MQSTAFPRRKVLCEDSGVTMPHFARFLFVGFLNTAVGYSTILFFQHVVSLGYLVSNALGYMVGGLVSYVLNKSFTFGSSRAHGEALPRFVLAVAICYLINLVVLEVSIAHWNIPAAIAQGVAMFAYTVTFFFLSKWFVFGERGPA